MVRAVASLLALVWVGTADAAPTRRAVNITTEPEGAMVYLDTVEDGPICDATPCTVQLPVGDNTVILELANHQRLYEQVVVPRRGKVKRHSFQLVAALGYVVLDEPEGAELTIDGVSHGEAPTRAEVTPDAHRVLVTLDGETLYDEYLDVTDGGEHLVEIEDPGSRGGSGDDEEDPTRAGEVTAKAGPRGRDRFLRASAAFDIGFRAFRYREVETGQTLRDASENGQLLAGPVIELWPGVLAGVDKLRGLSVRARYQYGLNKQDLRATGLSGPTNTFWQSLELSLRQRWQFGRFGIGVSAGYVRDQFQFEGAAQDILKVPDVDYQSLRVGGELSLQAGPLEPYVSFENRIVTSGGNLGERFEAGTTTSGLHGALGLALRHGSLRGVVEGAWTHYSWNFQFAPDAMRRAEGASDSVKKVQLSIGYEY